MAQKPRVSRRMPGTTPTTPSLDQILEFCARDPVERVFLEDIARRGLGRFRGIQQRDRTLAALCHVGANIVPSGERCDRFGDSVANARGRMMIGEADAVDALWAA